MSSNRYIGANYLKKWKAYSDATIAFCHFLFCQKTSEEYSISEENTRFVI